MLKWFRKSPDYTRQIAELLAFQSNKEELLGVKPPLMPNPDQIRQDAAKLTKYSLGEDYKRYADEIWSRVISDLDIILNEKTSVEAAAYHRGALKRSLDLLRLSYQARALLDSMDQERQTSSRS